LSARRAELEGSLRELLGRFPALGTGAGALSHAAEWLLDNSHLIQGALRQVGEDLPAAFGRTLPVMRDGSSRGQLRVAVLARQIRAGAIGPLDLGQIRSAVETWQAESTLTLGELWGLPALLRLEAVEDLVLAAHALLAGTDPAEGEQDFVQRIADDILTLRTLTAADWRPFVESASRVESELRQDPAGVYARMDFATRDRYRKAVEELAKGSRKSEPEVARAAVLLAREAAEDTVGAGRTRHVGFHLIGEGRLLLERRLGYRPPLKLRPGRWVRRHPAPVYLGSIGVATLVVTLLPLLWAAALGTPVYRLAILGAILLLTAGTVAVSLVSSLVTLSLRPRLLPRMGFDEDLPGDCRTLVGVPCMLTSADEIRSLLNALEVRFLGNSGRNLGFALLSDFGDAPAREMPGDAELLRLAREGIRELERRYQGEGAGSRDEGNEDGGAPRFFLLHRERRWNPAEGVWMGWERKRGKLAELDRLLAGHTDTGFTAFEGDLQAFGRVRYVITLDADTLLPRGAAARQAATLAHPLNQAELDAEGRVVAGYTVLQPRVAVAPESGRTRFSRLFAGETGLDLYTRAVSDVYQDLFGIGIYAGKGIYDPAAFEAGLAGRVPENALLSHDLFEGLHGRAGLVSDVLVLEDYPPNLLASLQRLHRWVRGDWQLLPWLLPRVPAAEPGTTSRRTPRIANRLPLIGLFMISDNLRRSLFAPALLLLLALGWLWLPGAWVWTAAGIATLALPLFLGGLTATWRIARGAAWMPTMVDAAWTLRTGLGETAAALAVLPCEAFVTLDAILRTLARLVTRRHLLEWVTAAQASRRLGDQPGAGAYWRGMAAAPLCGLALGGLIAALAPAALAGALPVLVLWVLSPWIAAWLGRVPAPGLPVLSAGESRQLRVLARRTWHFYERFVGPEDHWLPPDNFQEEPGGIVAHRTSPTNIGMLLLSTFTAYDLGYLDEAALTARLANTLSSLDRLELFRGHLWNWYDTRSLAPLEPRYVSTVDSGNLAACLLAVARGCEEAARNLTGPGLRPAYRRGMIDVLGVLSGVLREVKEGSPSEHAEALAATLEQLGQRVRTAVEPEAWRTVLREMEERWLPQVESRIVTLAEISSPSLDAAHVAELGDWSERIRHQLEVCRRALDRPGAEDLRRDLLSLARRADARAGDTDFSFLFDRGRRLFRIGFNASTGEPDPNHYDLLASEARIASLLAIAKGDVPQSHWAFLGRPFARVGAERTLLSWGGTMFEFLMPRLLMWHPELTPLAESCRTAVHQQIAFGREQGIPWGVSESGYAELDVHRNYRYRAFGVPGLGLKRDLGDRLVVTPYACVLALSIEPHAVLANLARLTGLGLLGRYGLFEAIDFGPAQDTPRLPRIVSSYMAHHQGMILAALGNALCGDLLVRRFQSDPRMVTVELLLHERAPRYAPLREPPAAAEAGAAPLRFEAAAISSWPVLAKGRPQMQLLSNGRYSVLISSRGGGSSRWNDRVLVRGEADPSLDPQGTWIYVEDLSSGEVWTAGGGPRPHGAVSTNNSSDATEGTEVHFAPHLAELHSRHHGVETRVLVTVAPVDDLEVRLVRLVNETSKPRHLALSSYGEVVLAGSAEDRRHPAFGKLFVESTWVERGGTLVFRRRPRTPGEEPLVLGHTLVAGDEGRPEPVRWETDRARFLGRIGSPGGVNGLSGTVGTTLDPIFALRRRVDLPPHGEVEVAFLTAAGRSRSAVLSVLQRNRSIPRLYAVVEQARARARLALRDAGLPLTTARHVQELLSAVLQAHPALRPAPEILAANRLGQPALWPHGISGDRPILLVRARQPEDGELVREILAAHSLWRRHRVGIDLVVLDEGATTYDQPLKEWLDREITRTGGDEWRDRPGGVFVVRGALLEPADLNLLEAVAAAVLDTSHGSLEEQLRPLRQAPPPDRLPLFIPIPSSPLLPEPTPPLERPEDLLFDNGLGGFTRDGREYVVHLQPRQATPAAWIDVIANPGFGFMASESGGGYTWAGNSAEDRLTPWRNDPVLDTPGETLYLRDEETGEIWTPTRLPAGGDSPCQARFEVGSVSYLQSSHGLRQELRLSVPAAAPVKIAALRLTNLWQRPRRITATYYAEWVLGTHRRSTAANVVSEYDAGGGALLARCSFPSGGERTAFLAASHPVHGLTADRAEFLGDAADRACPAGLLRIGLTGATGPGLDPCAALQLHLEIPPGATVEVHFLLGQGADRQEALDLAARFRGAGAVADARQEVEGFWDHLLGNVQVSTPEPEIDLLVNRWLLHQSLSCRIRGRSGLYQSSGAFGFRDQLQDVLALLHAAPEIARAHILEAARHQFEEGDVLHWWHPPEDRGVRTLCSDDLLWLPYVVAQYVAATQDRSILAEEVRFLAGPPLPAGEAEHYDRYPVSERSASLYEHCRRAIRRGTTAGPHGLPLIGSCDWNDGMNRVGPGGVGESVWLAWFLFTVLNDFAPLCEIHGDMEEAGRLRQRAETLRQAVEAAAWDGDWYLRAWYDDGTPLGAAGSPECEIDLIAQSWAVLSGAADPDRAARAMGSAWDRLVRPEAGLTLLLAPPFGRGKKDPGYIQAYPPGIRENGGQYSHAAAWAAWAFAKLGDGDRAAAVLRTILPVVRASTPEGVEHYRVEPYAVPADIAGVPPHTGRGGWTWYTGTASWTWRVTVEAILGLRRREGFLEIAPCIPREWPGFEAVLKAGSAVYRVRVENPDHSGTGVSEAWLDGERLDSAKLPLTDDGREHEVRVRLAPAHPVREDWTPFRVRSRIGEAR
jgi:cyclic beta-1,2-glucan synthetase